GTKQEGTEGQTDKGTKGVGSASADGIQHSAISSTGRTAGSIQHSPQSSVLPSGLSLRVEDSPQHSPSLSPQQSPPSALEQISDIVAPPPIRLKQGRGKFHFDENGIR